MTRANDVRERCRNERWDSCQPFEGYKRPWGLKLCPQSVEISLFKAKCRTIYGVAAIAACRDGPAASRFCSEPHRNRRVGTTITARPIAPPADENWSWVQELSAGWASKPVAGGKESKSSTHNMIYRSFCDDDESSLKEPPVCESRFTRTRVVKFRQTACKEWSPKTRQHKKGETRHDAAAKQAATAFEINPLNKFIDKVPEL